MTNQLFCANCHEPITLGELVSGETWCTQCRAQSSVACNICLDLLDSSKAFSISRGGEEWWVCEADLLVFSLDRRWDRCLNSVKDLLS